MTAGDRTRFVRAAGPSRGFSLMELLCVLALLGILTVVSVPLLAETVARERLRAAGWETAVLLRGLRQKSVARGAGLGLRFVRSGSSWSCSLYRDGNGNGILTADILSGRDPLLEGPRDPGALHEGIRVGLPEAPVPRIPPGSGVIANPADPVKFGRSDIISFSPSGSISSGTLYLTDGQRVLAVIVYGATGRIRILEFDPGKGWEQGP